MVVGEKARRDIARERETRPRASETSTVGRRKFARAKTPGSGLGDRCAGVGRGSRRTTGRFAHTRQEITLSRIPIKKVLWLNGYFYLQG